RQGPIHEADATFLVAAIIAATGIVGSFFLKNFHSDGTRQVQASSNLFRSAMDALGGIGERCAEHCYGRRAFTNQCDNNSPTNRFDEIEYQLGSIHMPCQRIDTAWTTRDAQGLHE